MAWTPPADQAEGGAALLRCYRIATEHLTDCSRVPPVSLLLSRRQAALALLASAVSLACCDKPDEEIAPYVEQPERVAPGANLRFATSVAFKSYGPGVLATTCATTYEGRPTKLEGNAGHPASLGATDAFAEAAILSLYDPDRSRAVHADGAHRVEGFLAALRPRLSALEASGGAGLRLLAGHITSPTLLRLIGEPRTSFPAMQWRAHEPIGEENARAGPALAFGRLLASLPRLERATVVLALDADPLGPGPDQIRHARGFAAHRTARQGSAAPFSPWYAAEPVVTATGAKADHRLAAHPAPVREGGDRARRPARRGPPRPNSRPGRSALHRRSRADLQAQPGQAVVLTGEWQSPEVHALVHRINARLDAPVDYRESVGPDEEPASLAALADDLRGKRVDTLLILGANPAYHPPAAPEREQHPRGRA